LFRCEGDKPTDSLRKVQLTNSDPLLLKAFVGWLHDYYGVPKFLMKLRLHLWQGSDETTAKKLWSRILGVPLKNFTKSWIKPVGKKNSHPYGVCRVSFSSKELASKIRRDMDKEFGGWPELYSKPTYLRPPSRSNALDRGLHEVGTRSGTL